jgi:hypothetical protein
VTTVSAGFSYDFGASFNYAKTTQHTEEENLYLDLTVPNYVYEMTVTLHFVDPARKAI